METCSFCENTIIANTFYLFTTYRYEDRDYKIIREGDKVKGYFEVFRYCPACLLKYCLGCKNVED